MQVLLCKGERVKKYRFKMIPEIKVAIYCRVSTEEQTTENQIVRLTEFVKSNGWNYEVIEET